MSKPAAGDTGKNRGQAGVRGLYRLVEWAGSGMADVAGWVYVLIAAMITVDVLARRFLGFSLPAALELSTYMMAIGISWGLTHALTTRAHVRVEVLVMKLPPGIRAYLHAVALALLTFTALFFAWSGWTVISDSMLFSATDPSELRIPLVIPQTLWTIGLVFFGVAMVVMLLDMVALLAAGNREEVDQILGPRSIDEETKEALEAAGMEEPEQRKGDRPVIDPRSARGP